MEKQALSDRLVLPYHITFISLTEDARSLCSREVRHVHTGQVHPFMVMYFLIAGFSQQKTASRHTVYIFRGWFVEHDEFGLLSPIHGCSTLQLTGLNGPAANSLMADTTGHLRGTSLGQSCFQTISTLGRCP